MKHGNFQYCWSENYRLLEKINVKKPYNLITNIIHLQSSAWQDTQNFEDALLPRWYLFMNSLLFVLYQIEDPF